VVYRFPMCAQSFSFSENIPRVSQDGKCIVYNTDDGTDAIVWTYELSRVRVTADLLAARRRGGVAERLVTKRSLQTLSLADRKVASLLPTK